MTGNFAYAGDITINKFLGLNTQDSSGSLPDGYSPSLLNVNITPGGLSVFKRDGYGLYKSMSISTSAIHGGTHFQDASGNDIQLWGGDRYLNAIVSGASPVQVATGTLNATWQCTDSNGSAYCFTTARDTPVKTDGTTGGTSYQTAIPSGTITTSSPNRLFVAGVSGYANTVYASEDGVFTNFTVGLNDTSPFTEVIVAPGSRITHLRYACGKLLWWKDQSFGYMVGDTQYDIENKIVTTDIGTLDNSSAEYNGIIYFRGQDNHIYQYDCSNVTRLSREITPTVQSSSRRKANSWTQTTASDWNNGYFYSSSIDTTTYPGDVSLKIASGTTFENPSFETCTSGFGENWSNDGPDAMFGGGCVTSSVGGCTLNPQSGSYFAFPQYGRIISTVTVNLIDASDGSVILSSGIPSQAVNDCTWVLNTLNVSTGSYRKLAKFRYSVNDPIGGKLYLTSTHGIILAGPITFYTNSQADGISGFRWTAIDNIQGGGNSISSGTYYSAVDNAPNLTSFSTFGINDNIYGGAATYYSRSSTNSFTVGSSTPTWVIQPKNGVVSASTGTYFQTRVDLSISTNSTALPRLNDVTFNWFEGSASDKAYLQFFNDNLWVSVSSGTSGLNNRIQRWDTLNQTWLLDDIAANGMVVDQGRLYLGSPSTGVVYMFGQGVTTDNGNAINSYWKSRDYVGNDPWVMNEYVASDFIMKEANTTVTATYTVDTSTATSISLNLYDPVRSIVRRSRNLPPGKKGTFYNLMISDNSSSPRWELMGARTRYNALGWQAQ